MNVTIKICAVGWEPNPGHASYLSQLEAHYTQCGHRVILHTMTGVGTQDTEAQFARLRQDPLLLNVWPMELPSRFVTDEEIKVSHLVTLYKHCTSSYRRKNSLSLGSRRSPA